MPVLRWLFGALLVGAAALALTACHGHPHTFTVTTTADGVDAQVGDGVCEVTVGAGDCTLRAAIDEANTTPDKVEVHVPEGIYVLSLPGSDDTNAGGDLDLRHSGTLDLVGLGAGAAIQAPGLDGALDTRGGTTVLTKVGVSGAAGAGITVRSGTSVSVAFSSLHHNGGAGLQIEAGAAVNALHSTLSTNGAGGVRADGTFVADYVTITANTGGGITGTGTTTLGQSAIGAQASGPSCSSAVTSGGWNLTTDSSCGLTGTGDESVQSAGLQALSTDLVPFHRPASQSLVMDAIPVDSGVCGSFLKSTDQRSAPRPTGSACDRGAIEAGGRSFVVGNPADVIDAHPGDGVCDVGNGTCTLRAAITEANADPGPDTITLTVDPTQARPGQNEDANLAGDLDVTDSLAIEGNGHTIDGGQIDRVVHHRWGRLEIHGATVTNGRFPSTAGTTSGGGVYSQGLRIALELDDVEVTDNAREGVYVSGAVEIRRSAIRANGTGLRVLSSGMAVGTVTESVISSNPAGGVRVNGGLHILRSAIIGNGSDAAGAAIQVFPCPFGSCPAGVQVTSSTISGNTGLTGGAIYAEPSLFLPGVMTIRASTIVDNDGGGIQIPATVGASIVAGNPGGDCIDTPTSLGGNLDADGTCSFGASDLPSADPLLTPLDDHGGPTPTHLPYAISPVLDATAPGTVGLCDASLTTDQRGEARPVGTGCDVGAVEGSSAGSAPVALVVDSPADAGDAAPGDGVCDAGGMCTLRAAIDETNALAHPLNVITVADGVDPILTRTGRGEDGNRTGDLDVLAPVTIDGAGARVDAAGVDRVLDVASPSVDLDRITVTGGRIVDAGDSGAGIRVRLGDLDLERSTVTDNRVSGSTGRGGGLVAMDATSVRVRQTTFHGNQVAGYDGAGGGIASFAASVTVTTSTFSGNVAFVGAAIDVSPSASASIVASTITANSGYIAVSGSESLVIRGSILGPGTTYACGRRWPGGTNTSFDDSCGFSVPNVDPALGPLVDNGGPTLTHLLPAGSPLRDLVPLGPECEQASAVDQRGEPRPQGTACDLGSVEEP